MIIETAAGQNFQVTDTGDADTRHVWHGIEVKRSKGKWVVKKNARSILIRKEGCRQIAA